MKVSHLFNLIVLIILIVATINYGLESTLDMNIIEKIPIINHMDKLIGIVVGASAVYLAYLVIIGRQKGKVPFAKFLSN